MRTLTLKPLAGIVALAAVLGTASTGWAQTTVRAPRRQMNVRRALVVGVGTYEQASPLQFSGDDAKAFADFLKKQWGYPDTSVTLMTDDASDAGLRPTLANLQAQVKALVEATTKDTEVVVYFAGYGARQAREEWLVPTDGNPKNIPATSLSSDRLVNDLVAKRPKRALLFLDADRNLQISSESVTVATRAFRSAPRGMELGVIYSCEAGERSRSVKAPQSQGVFTHFLLQGLAGDREAAAQDGSITFDALSKYVYGKVRQYVSKEYSGAQSPHGIATNAEMVLGKAAAR